MNDKQGKMPGVQSQAGAQDAISKDGYRCADARELEGLNGGGVQPSSRTVQSYSRTTDQSGPSKPSTYNDPISRTTWIVLAGIAAASLLGHLALLPSMPAEIPIHWDANGNVNGWGTPSMQVFLSALPLLLLGVFYATPRMDPSGRNYECFGGLWRVFVVAMTVFIIAVSWMTELTVFGILPQNGNPMGAFVMSLLGVGLIALANYMPRVRHNYTFGCKTPWTLANLENWRLTHRFAGRLLLIVGICMIASGVLSWLSTTKALGVDLSDATLALTLVPLFASLAAIFVYSLQLPSLPQRQPTAKEEVTPGNDKRIVHRYALCTIRFTAMGRGQYDTVGDYRIFFWSNEGAEPVHVHVCKGVPNAHTTKILLTRQGGCIVANNASKIPAASLRDLLEHEEAPG